MEQITQFVINNWFLFAMFVIILLMIFRTEFSNVVRGVRLLTPQEVTQYINHKNAVVIDTRDEKAFNDGHILGAINVPAGDIEVHLKKLKKYQKKPIILSCNTGQSAIKVGVTLMQQGFEQVFNLKGGISAWNSASLPLNRVE